jgi:hypothetical protein
MMIAWSALRLPLSTRPKSTSCSGAKERRSRTWRICSRSQASCSKTGGDEDEAIAGLLHDAIEDTDVTFDDLTARFGPKVAEIVQGCSDTDVKPKPPWRARKEAYLAHLIDARPEVVRVSLADKVHNARSVLFDYRLMGEELWARFNPDADQLWYYRSLVEVFRRVSRSPLVDELDRVVTELEGLTRHAPDTDT